PARSGWRRSRTTLLVIAQAVVHLALLGIAQYFISRTDLLEALLGRFVPRVYVRMVLARKSAVDLADFLLRGIALHTKNFVVIFLAGHDDWPRRPQAPRPFSLSLGKLFRSSAESLLLIFVVLLVDQLSINHLTGRVRAAAWPAPSAVRATRSCPLTRG